MDKHLVMPTVNPVINGLKPSPTLVANEIARQRTLEGKKTYRFGFGQSPFPVPNFLVEALARHAAEKDYLPVKGLTDLRQAIADFHSRQTQQTYSAEQIIVGPGSKELLFLTQYAFNGNILLPAPSWVSYYPQALLANRQVHWIDCLQSHHYMMRAEELEGACMKLKDEAKMLILNYPNNPTGATYSVEELQAIAAVARKHMLIIISDEIYSETTFKGQHHSLAEFYPEGTIISNGLSKWAGAGGWRMGSFCFPKQCKWLLDAVACMASETFSAVHAPTQYAAVEAFSPNPQMEDYLRKIKKTLSFVSSYTSSSLREAEIFVPESQGGFYHFLNFEQYRDILEFNGIHTSADLCRLMLMEAGVALLPGSAFGRDPQEFTTRFAFVDFDGAASLQFLEKNKNLNDAQFDQLFPNISTGLSALKSWLGALKKN